VKFCMKYLLYSVELHKSQEFPTQYFGEEI